MDDREHGDVRVGLEHATDILGIDRRVIRNRQLDHLTAVLPYEMLISLAEDARDEIEDFRAWFDHRRRSGFQPKDGLGLHDNHVVLCAEHLLQQVAGAGECLDEDRIIVIDNRSLHRPQCLVRDINRTGSERQSWPLGHWDQPPVCRRHRCPGVSYAGITIHGMMYAKDRKTQARQMEDATPCRRSPPT